MDKSLNSLGSQEYEGKQKFVQCSRANEILVGPRD